MTMGLLTLKQSLLFVFGSVLFNILVPYLLPYGPAVFIAREDYAAFAEVDLQDKSLQVQSGKTVLIEERREEQNKEKQVDQKGLLINGPETILFDGGGTMYIMSEDAKLVKLSDFQQRSKGDATTWTVATTMVADLGVGRPLGGKFVADDNGLTSTLYIADALLGLVRVKNIPRTSDAQEARVSVRPKVELIASRVLLKDGNWSRVLFADDLDIGPITGHVYFSDATDIPPDRIGTQAWDTLGASTADGVRGKKTGRILRYKPETDEVDILVESGILFANGVAVDREENFLLVSETFGIRILKYHLKGPKKGNLEVLTGPLVGFPDGMDCSFQTGKCYAAIASSKPSFFKLLERLPPKVNQIMRTITLMLPKTLNPQPSPYGAFVELDPNTGHVTRVVQDPTGKDLRFITGVTEHEGKLYLGSLNQNVIGAYDLN